MREPRLHLSAAELRRLSRALLGWFRLHQRPLPWRSTRDPYPIWVSEIMLQQTQAATVIPYFERFLQAFPTIEHLAGATEQEVLRQWEGLGYYRRARSLHRAAQEVCRRHGGSLPARPELLAELPGIGKYTLGAILSQAFDQPAPAIDANAARVLARWFAWNETITTARSQQWLEATARSLLPRRGAGEFNQALMELGALVCTARAPRCGICPVRPYCRAHALGCAADLPRKRTNQRSEVIEEVALVVRRRGRFLLLQRRADADRWPTMWEFPHGPRRTDETEESAVRRVGREQTGLECSVGETLGMIRHGVTRFLITVKAFEAEARIGRLRTPAHAAGRWLALSEFETLPLPAAQRRLAQLIAVRNGR